MNPDRHGACQPGPIRVQGSKGAWNWSAGEDPIKPMDRQTRSSSTARALVIVACLVVIVSGMRAANSRLGPFLMAAFFAATCTVPLTWLQRKAVPSKLAVGLVAGDILGFGSLLVVLLALSVEGLLADLPTYKERLGTLTASAIAWLNARGVPVFLVGRKSSLRNWCCFIIW